jgi:hypothetical protein
MIVFAIVFGEQYIESFFDTALPSLLTPKNVPALVQRDLDVSLVFFTTESSVPIIAERIKTPAPGMEHFTHVDISYLQDKPMSDYADRGQWQNDTMRDLMMKAVAYCVKADQPFIFANADVLYSNGIVENCYRLHRATSKVVAAFNGRVDPGDELNAFHQIRGSGDNGFKKAFLRYRSPLWRSWTVASSEELPDANFGHIILEDGDFIHLFCANPNPFLGKFTTEDLVFFTDSDRFVDWDSRWRVTLANNHRLVVLTNLDAGMSMEIDPASSDAKMLGHSRVLRQRAQRRSEATRLLDEWGMDVAAYEAELRRAHYDTEFNMFCFTTRGEDAD